VSTKLFGQRVLRLEDEAVLRGQSAYLDDLPVRDALHVAFVRSPIAHGRLLSIEVSEANRMPDVRAVVTAADLGEANGPHPHPTWFAANAALQAAIDPLARPEHLELLARRVVRYAGTPLAAVLATDPYSAADGAEAVEVDIDELPLVMTMEHALAPDAALLHPEWGDNVCLRFKVAKGDIEQAWAQADVVVEEMLTMGRQTGTPMEPRGVVAQFDGAVLEVWSSTQAPHWLRNALVTVTGLAKDKIRVIAPHVGGGFGIKSMVYPEELAVALLAIRTGRRLKWVETRSEHFMSVVHSRDQRHEVALALSADGRILGLRDRYTVDCGASNVEALVVPYNTTAHLQGGYRIPALDVQCTGVLTNKAPLSAYRGAGRPEAVFAIERVLELAARRLAIDPLELRLRNLLRPDEIPYDAGIPYRDGSPLILDIGDVAESLSQAAAAVDYPHFRRRQADLRRTGRYVGVGVATYVEGTGIGPGELAEIEILANGDAEIRFALPSQGQGHATVMAQICADYLGLPLHSIHVRQGDTSAVVDGGGTIASRTVTVVGNSVALAASQLAGRMLHEAAAALEARPEDLELDDGAARVKGAPHRAITFAELASRASLVEQATFTVPGVTFANGTHMAVVDVDPRTGVVAVEQYVAAHDCGRVVNPMIVDGQVIGGVAQGIGGALLEELVYDSNGQLVTGSFMSYLVPRATDLPEIAVRHLETPSKRNPLGIKGVGEAGTIGAAAALANAIDDALSPFGAVVTRCPMTPPTVAALVEESALGDR
jgi:carbon-monoxide dehydrogenase large subunit